MRPELRRRIGGGGGGGDVSVLYEHLCGSLELWNRDSCYVGIG